jgi:hypothetical protein
MKMEEKIDYFDILYQVITNLSAKPDYLKGEVKDKQFNQSYFDGMAISYHFMMDEIIETLKTNEIDLKKFNLENINSTNILEYKPKKAK